MLVQIDPKDFLRFIPEELHRIVDEEDIISFCETTNNLRKGILEKCTVNIRWVKQLNFKNCRITLKNGHSFLLKNSREHRQYVSGSFTICLGPIDENKICQEYSSAPIYWHCIKAPEQVYPRSGDEFLRVKFRKYDMHIVNAMIETFDVYAKAYVEAFNNMEKA